MLRVGLLVLLASSAYAACPNQCSGHGTCGNDDVCTCYQDWLTGDLGATNGDCSQRRCPYDHAWSDAPTAANTAHALAECSGKGICDRKTGECECFDGYWGKGCRRAQCPNDCSGHGTCEYMKELRTDVGDQFKWTGQAPTSDQFYHSFAGLWDFDRQMACLCDAKWTDIDCSRRMCPKGNYALYSDTDQVDEVQLVANLGATASWTQATISFSMIFRSTLGEEFTTRPVFFADDAADSSSDAILQNALKALPNRVIQDVTITHADGSDTVDTFQMSVTFAGACNTGDVNQLNVITHTCAAGCMPVLTSTVDSEVTGPGPTHFVLSTVTPGTKVNTECSGRGVCDYESGICDCFSGYTDESCSTQTALI